MNNRIMQPTYKRQRFLLAFISQLQNGVSATDLQKLVFLYLMSEGISYYEFVPYKFGAYSFQLAEDVEILRKSGYLSQSTSRIQTVNKYSYGSSFLIVSERGNDLIRKAYRDYPYYAINSEIIDRLFRKEEAERFHKSKEKYMRNEQILFTIGYEGRSIEKFINTLIQNDVRILVDVRKNPISRKFGFSKAKLEHIVRTVGIDYVHIPELGIDSEKRVNLNTPDDYSQLFKAYSETLSDHIKQIEGIYKLLCSNIRIALMCFEKESKECHRHVIRDYMKETYGIRSVDL